MPEIRSIEDLRAFGRVVDQASMGGNARIDLILENQRLARENAELREQTISLPPDILAKVLETAAWAYGIDVAEKQYLTAEELVIFFNDYMRNHYVQH